MVLMFDAEGGRAYPYLSIVDRFLIISRPCWSAIFMSFTLSVFFFFVGLFLGYMLIVKYALVSLALLALASLFSMDSESLARALENFIICLGKRSYSECVGKLDLLIIRQRNLRDLGFSLILVSFGLHILSTANIIITLGFPMLLPTLLILVYIGFLLNRTSNVLGKYKYFHRSDVSRIFLRATILHTITIVLTIILFYTTIVSP